MLRGEAAGRRPVPPPDCPACARLVAFRHANRLAFPDWHNAPVPSFGPGSARLLVVGLAPGLRGANRSGRPFTGDHAGVILYATLQRYGFAGGTYDARVDDGLELIDCRITNAVRCVPPENRPTAGEVVTCRRYLEPELRVAPMPEVVLPLGKIAHDSVLRALGVRVAAFPFRHGALYRATGMPTLAPSYHCSRYNLNTGRLTPSMFDAVFDQIRTVLR